MGIWVRCENSKIELDTFYSTWNHIRHSLVFSFIKFLTEWTKNNSFVEGHSFEFGFCEDLKKLIIEFNNMDNQLDIDILIKLFGKYKNALSCFNFFGIYALIDKEDCEAYYSSGNAFDIYILIKTIKPYIDKEYIKFIRLFNKICKYSIDKHLPIIIS